MNKLKQILRTDAPSATILVRLLVGSVFLSEGIQKFLYPAELAAARFEKIGIPFSQIMGPFVAGVEIVCGTLIIVGLLTRPAAIALLIDSSVAILSTKIPMLLGHGFWEFSLPKLRRCGFWSMMHEARTDFSMWLGLLFYSSSAQEENGRSTPNLRMPINIPARHPRPVE